MAKYFLKSERLGFTTWKAQDINLAMSLWGDAEVTRLIDARGVLSQEQVQEKLTTEISRFENFGVQYWPIYYLKTDDFAGCCGLRPYNKERDKYEIGIHLKKKFWGMGLAYEAAQAVIEYAFETLGVKALFAGHNPRNKASRQILTKLGFEYTHDEFYPPTGLNHPSYILKSNR